MEMKAKVFKDSVRTNFKFLKETDALDALHTKSIALKDGAGFLLPVCALHESNDELIQIFTEWRNEFSFAYPTQFKATPESTRTWLRKRLLDVDDRMLFFVTDAQGRIVGHIGLANAFASADQSKLEIEIDNVVRGKKSASPGIMGKAMDSLILWAEDVLGAEHVFLRVFEDNTHAVDFYKKNGFASGERTPLRKHQDGSTISYKSIDFSDKSSPDKTFLRMDFTRRIPDVGKSMILTAGPSISARESYYAYDAAKYGWNNNWNKYIKKFETSFAEYIGTKFALSTSSCTGALHLGLLGLGIGPGDEVIVPDITWVATANAVAYTGATPIFADIDENTWCLDPASFESKITERTKAVMPVHLYGHPAAMDRIVEIARKHKLFIVEDAAPSIGTTFKGRKTGTFGDVAAFSFQGAKLAVTGEGGMLVCNNEDVYKKIYSLWDQGRDLSRTFWINETGWKYKMSNVQAGIGLGQLERVEQLIEAKRRVFSWYEQGLKGTKHLKLCFEPKDSRSIYWMSSIQVLEASPVGRDALREELKKRNVDTRPVFPAISQYPIWNKKQEPLPIAKKIGESAINLPSGVCLKKDQVEYVCRAIRSALGQA